MAETLLSIGHGYSAEALARRLMPQGWRVIGTTRSPERAEQLRSRGVEAVIWPGANLRPAIADATHLLSSVSPRNGDPVIAALGEEIAAAAPHLAWVGYLSTTGVYGDRQGGWVDEASPLAPATRRGAARVEAEQEWQALARRVGLPLHIFRLAGIYGPGRGPFEKVRAGAARRIVKPGQVFSRIHVDDIAATLEASIARPAPGRIYNVCDDLPASAAEVTAYACELLGVAPPPLIPLEAAELSPMALSFWQDNRLVSNRRLHEELGVTLAYPDYRAGLRAILAAESA